MAGLFLLQQRHAIRRERIFPDRYNPLELPDDELIGRYRVNRQSILHICEVLNDDLRRATNRSLLVTKLFNEEKRMSFFSPTSSTIADTSVSVKCVF